MMALWGVTNKKKGEIIRPHLGEDYPAPFSYHYR